MSQSMKIVLYVKQAIWLYDFEMLQTWYLFYYYHHQIGSIHFSFVIIFSAVVCLRCFLHHILSLIAYTFRENRLVDRTHLFVQNTISLSSLCKLIWRHWTYKMPVIYFVKCVGKIKHILSVIHYTICGAVCFQFTQFSCDDWENIYTLSYYHHQIGSMNYYPLFRARSWNNGVCYMSLYILILIWWILIQSVTAN